MSSEWALKNAGDAQPGSGILVSEPCWQVRRRRRRLSVRVLRERDRPRRHLLSSPPNLVAPPMSLDFSAPTHGELEISAVVARPIV